MTNAKVRIKALETEIHELEVNAVYAHNREVALAEVANRLETERLSLMETLVSMERDLKSCREHSATRLAYSEHYKAETIELRDRLAKVRAFLGHADGPRVEMALQALRLPAVE